MSRNLFQYLLLVSLFAISCTLDTPGDDRVDAGSVIILNQGAFNQGSASLSEFNPTTRQIQHTVFLRRNGRPLGDVLQSAESIGNLLYLVVNNSRKIEVVELESLSSVRTITMPVGSSPRYIAASDANTGWVTSLFSNYVYKVNLGVGVVTDSVFIGAGSEDIHFAQGRLFVTRNLNADFSTASGVSVINPVTGIVESVIPTLAGPQRIVALSGQLWVNCTGNFGANDGGLIRIDPVNRLAAQQIALSAGTAGMAVSTLRNELYVLSNGILRIPVNDIAARTHITSRYFYGIGVYDKTDFVLYASDAKNFSVEGSVIMYNAGGIPIDSVTAGIVPADFFFKN